MSDIVNDALILRQTEVQRYSAGVQRDFLGTANELDAAIRVALAPFEEITTRADERAANAAIDDAVGSVLDGWLEGFIIDLQSLASDQQLFAQEAIDSDPGIGGIDWGDAIPFAPLLLALIPLNQSGSKTAKLGSMINQSPVAWARELRNQVALGRAQGLETDVIVRNMVGSRRNRKGSVLGDIIRAVEGVSRTAANSITNQVNMSVYQRSDVIKLWEYIAVLDSGTTAFCRTHDGRLYPVGTGPVPPNHYRCRSMALPLIGSPIGKSNYYDWLAKQPRDVQIEVLGKTKTRLFRSGEIGRDEFGRLLINAMGKPRTLDEIQRLRPDAWRRAGL